MLKKVASLACGAILAAASFVVGQEVVEERTTTTVPAAGVAGATQSRRVSQILGSTVQLEGGAGYGKVEDIILDDSGRVEYMVVAREGSYALFPWAAANVNYGKRVVVYNVSPQVVQPLFVTGRTWPSPVDQVYVGRVGKVFGQRALRREIRRGEVVPVQPVP